MKKYSLGFYLFESGKDILLVFGSQKFQNFPKYGGMIYQGFSK